MSSSPAKQALSLSGMTAERPWLHRNHTGRPIGTSGCGPASTLAENPLVRAPNVAQTGDGPPPARPGRESFLTPARRRCSVPRHQSPPAEPGPVLNVLSADEPKQTTESRWPFRHDPPQPPANARRVIPAKGRPIHKCPPPSPGPRRMLPGGLTACAEVFFARPPARRAVQRGDCAPLRALVGRSCRRPAAELRTAAGRCCAHGPMIGRWGPGPRSREAGGKVPRT